MKKIKATGFWTILIGLFSLSLGISPMVSADTADLWSDVDEQQARSALTDVAEPLFNPQAYRLVQPSVSLLQQRLSTAGEEGGVTLGRIELPRPEGGLETFKIWEVPTMAPELQAWMQSQGYDMRTYAGQSLENPEVTLRMDWGGPQGFHASVIGAGRSYYVDPRWKGNTDVYMSYARADADPAQAEGWKCQVDSDSAGSSPQEYGDSDSVLARSTNGNLRTYRLANAATGEYTGAVGGGTAAGGQAAIVTAINRVNQIYELYLSIRLVLIGNNQTIVYENAGTDPYTNDNGGAMLGENQNNLDATIGDANYDIGHVFSTGGGGVAGLGVPCQSGNKAAGVTGLPNPVGDPFYIDYVAHEMGHQFAGRHTWHGQEGGCDAGQRATGISNYEPGSGSTIQAYAGICGAQNLQMNSDPYFHYRSLFEMMTYTGTIGPNNQGNACKTDINVGGNPNEPTVDAGPDVTIPANTPFELTALNGMDMDAGSNLTYLWEQYDLGPNVGAPQANLASGDNSDNPIIRSSLPTASPTRSIPPLANVLDGTNASTRPGEILPTTNRTLTFRATAFDNDPDGGRFGSDTRTITVTTTGAGQFAVTSPNGGETLGNTHTVTWNTGSTEGAPVNATNVDIFYSTDGGTTFNPLLLNTPNDGTEMVTFPAGNTSQARIKVKGAGNIFYDISNANFTVNSVANPTVSIGNATVTEGNAGASTLSFTVTLSAVHNMDTVVTYNTADGTATTGDNDYVGVTNGTVTITQGNTTGTIDITVNGDVTIEPDETMTVTLASATNGVTVGAPASGTGTITNDDAPTVSIGDATVTEGNAGTSTLSFTVTLSEMHLMDTVVTYNTADGTATIGDNDYVGVTNGTVTITQGNTTGTIDITVNGDTAFEANETMTVALASATNGVTVGAPASGTGTINNDDAAPTVSIGDATVTEGNAGTSTLSFTVTLSAVHNMDTVVTYNTADGTATTGDNDYVGVTNGTVTITQGNTTGTIDITVNGDVTDEANETMTVTLASATNGVTVGTPASGTGTIINDDGTTVSIGDATVTEGNAGTSTLSFTVSLSQAHTMDTVVTYSTADGTATIGDNDYVGVTNGTVTITQGNTTGTIDITVNGDTVVEPSETMTVTLASATNGVTVGTPASGTGTITNDDAAPSVSIGNADAVIEGNSSTTAMNFTVTLSQPSVGDTTVNYSTGGTATSGTDYSTPAGAVMIANGQTTAVISIDVIGDTDNEPNETVIITLTGADNSAVVGTPSSGSGDIINDDGISSMVTIDEANGRPTTFATNFGTLTGVRLLTDTELQTNQFGLRLPGSHVYPNGVFAFNITGLAAGTTATVTITLPATARPSAYFKCYATGPCIQHTQTTITDNVVVLQLTDGGLGDTDATADGVITDPGAPGVAVRKRSGGGCAVGEPAQFDPLWLMLLISSIVVVSRRRNSARS